MGAVQVTELGHIVLFVRDLDRSASFYTNVLGFRPVIDRPSGQRGVMYRTASERTHHELLLIEAEAGATPAPVGPRVGLFHFGLKVGDSDDELREVVTLLQAGGVPIAFGWPRVISSRAGDRHSG
jgi:catechol 2,3-dioxygenase-like lactoylglutathione lyase family enzyme